MKKLKCSIWVLLLMSALSATAAKKPKPDEEVVYKKTEQGELALHIFYPDGHQKTDKRPVAVFFHGGGWKGGTPSMWVLMMSDLPPPRPRLATRRLDWSA